MDDLQAKIKADKEAKKKRLEELKAAKLAREGGRKREDEPRTSDSSDTGTARTPDITPRLSDPSTAQEPIFQVSRPVLTAYTESISCQPRQRVPKVEEEVQVEFDPPAKDQKKPDSVLPDQPAPESPKPHSQANTPSIAQIKDPGEAFKKPEVKAPNFEQVAEMPEFTEFFMKSIRLVERALDQEFDVCETFHGHDIGTALDTHSRLKLVSTVAEPLGDNRCIGNLQWSPTRPEVFLASYTLSGTDSGEHPRGVVKIWNLAAQEKPPQTLICQSTVTSATFVSTDVNLVYGGLYSGQIVVWDVRAKSAPVQRTPLIPEAHSQPLVSVAVYSTEQAVTQVASLSSEGKLCLWTLNMLHKPLQVSEVRQSGKDTACSSMTIPSPDTEGFYVGMEDGSIMEASLRPSKGEEVDETLLQAHSGPVTALDLHGVGETEGFAEGAGRLLLSASVDWTVKLWHLPTCSTSLLSLENYEDYVYTVKWSPLHPGTFAVGDGDGHLDVWDLLSSTESPIVRQAVSDGAVNQVAWSLHGARLAAGTSRGDISIFQLKQDQPKVADWLHVEQMFSLGNSSQRYSAHLLKLSVWALVLHADFHAAEVLLVGREVKERGKQQSVVDCVLDGTQVPAARHCEA